MSCKDLISIKIFYRINVLVEGFNLIVLFIHIIKESKILVFNFNKPENIEVLNLCTTDKNKLFCLNEIQHQKGPF